jgi:DNA-damage-inducible protein J
MAQINIRIDDDLKEQSDILFGELGLNMTTAFNMFVYQSGIPFAITTKTVPFYNGANMNYENFATIHS